jgi:predicted nucleotidyltransferase
VDIQTYLDKIAEIFKEEMKDNLTGIYLHGSLAMGCFNPDRSDIDLLVICEREMNNGTKRKIIKRLLSLTHGHRNQVEMSIVLKKYLDDFVYPTPFELHFFHPKYLTDDDYICGGKGFADPDLAGHFTVAYHRGIRLCGQELKEIFKAIDRNDYIESIFNDIKDAPNEITENPVYFTLNLCRVLYYLKKGVVSSKKEGGEWGLNHLPPDYRETVQQCLDVYSGKAQEINLSNHTLVEFSNWMLCECEQLK